MALNGEAIISNNKITGLEIPQWRDPLGRTNGPYYTLYGIRIAGNAVISNNIISGCTEASIKVTGWSGRNVIIESNTLNSKGIIIEYQVSAKINKNNIAGGVFLSQFATINVDATNNWWGTIDQTAISNSILDNKDDFNLGNVNFAPFLTEANPQAMPDPNAPMPTPSPTPSPSPTSTVTSNSSTSTSQNPTATPDQSGSQNALGVDWVQIATLSLLSFIAVLLIIVIVLVRKRSVKQP